jgi:CHAT domain-containing protein
MKGLGRTEPLRFRDTLDSLRETKDRLERILAQRLGTGSNTDNASALLTDSIRKRLPPHAILVEYFRFRNANLKDRDQYAALIVPADGLLSLRKLGDAGTVDSLMRAYDSQMSLVSHQGVPPNTDNNKDYREIARALDFQIWAPLASALPGDDVVFIAPDAELCLLSFAGLMNSSGRYLVEDRPVHYLTCGRSLLEDGHDASVDGALLVCDPDFDADARARAHADQDATWISAESTTISDYVTLRSSCEYLSDRRFVRLPGTRDEAETVRKQLSSRNLGAIELRMGAAASEEYLKHHAGDRRLLHLATHGFYLSRNCGKTLTNHLDGVDSVLVGENPLLLSGICLAGANDSDDSVAVEDGILTAEEVASLPLDGTQWVVLSACDTRLGETRHGEGVFGLQRAFQMAGANTVISALWSIPDRATTSFMTSLYASSGVPLYDAMRQSQLAAIAELRKRGQPDHPYNWGAFVAVGQWSPLD